MPTIPSYKRQIGEQNAPSVRVQAGFTPDMFGAGVGKAIGGVAELANDISVKMDKADLVKAESLLRQRSTEFLYNDIFKRQGTAAKDSDKVFADKMKEFAAEARGMVSGRAQPIFDQIVTNYQTSLYPDLQRHMTKQAEIALNDAYSAGLYTDALALSQEGYFRNRNSVAQLMAAGDASVAALYQGRAPEFIKAKQMERSNAVLGAALKTLHDKGDYASVDEFIKTYGDKMDPRTLAPYQGWVSQKNENVALTTEADRIAAMFGDNSAGAAEYIRGLKAKGAGETTVANAGKYFTGNISGMSDTLVNRLAKLAADKGINIVVTSGRRTKEEQAALYDKYQRGEGNLAAPPGTSRHESGGAIDTDSLENIPDEELRRYGLARTVKGESWHYEAVGTTNKTDPEYFAKLERSVFAQIQKNKAIKHDTEMRIRENLEDQLAMTTDPVARLQLIRESGLRPSDAKRMEALEINSRESDITMEMRLKFLDDNGKLTPADVNAAAELLSAKSYRAWMMKSVDSGTSRMKSEEEKRQKQIDAEITLRIDKEFSGKKEQDRSLIKNSIYATLNEKNLKGEERMNEARKLIAQEVQTSGIVYTNLVGRRDQLNDLKTKFPDKADLVTWLANSTGMKNLSEFEPFLAGLDLKDPDTQQALKNMQNDGAQLTPRNFEYALDLVRSRRAWSRGEKYTPVSPVTPVTPDRPDVPGMPDN